SYAAVLETARLRAVPPRELKFSKVPEGEPKFASFKAKWDEGYRERWGIFSGFPDDLSESLERSLATVAKRVFRALQMRGFGRIDLRLTDEGKLVVVEANPNPENARGEDLAEAAAKVALPYEDLIEKIAYLGLEASRPTG